MSPEQQFLKEHFLEPEVRDGVEVSAELKKVWKVLLDILEEIVKVCKKHDLEWTLEGGSLLGAIRHHGFIPWDDDIDVVMPRKYYDRFVEVAQSELPDYLFVQTTATAPGFHIPHVMVCDSRTTGADPTHINHRKTFNMGIRVDVLALDGMPSRFYRYLVRKWISPFKYAVPEDDGLMGRPFFRRDFRYSIGKMVFALLGREGVYRWKEFPLRAFPMDKYEWCGSLVARNFWHPHSIRKSEWFKEYECVPFEYLVVPVPKNYDQILTQQFGDWRRPVRGLSYHGKLIVDTEKSYKTVCMESFGYSANDFE